MPMYEYRCEECGFVTEALRKIDEKGDVECENCHGKNTEKIVSACSFSFGPTDDFRRGVDKARRVHEMKADLKENYGIEKIAMDVNTLGKTFEDTYRDIKGQGDGVKEAMKSTRENNQNNLRVKKKDWMEKALKRTPERGRLKMEKKKQEAFEKRRIVVS